MYYYLFKQNMKVQKFCYPATAIICLCIKFIVAKMSGKKMTEGQITILNQILIISMHIASWVKRSCYLLKLSSGNENMGVSRADNYVKIWRNLPISNTKQISLTSMHIASLVKISCYLLELSSGNENMGVSRADNSVKIWRNLPISNSKPDLLNVNAYSKYG